MRIYLDETIYDDILYGLLKKNNFEVIGAERIAMINKTDEEHLKCAFVYNAILITQNKNLQLEDSISHTKGLSSYTKTIT